METGSARKRLIFALDVPSADEAQRLIELLASEVGLFKVGLELFIRSGPPLVRQIVAAGKAGVFLDLKLHDIPATVGRAMAAAADLGVSMATVHCGEAPAMLEAAVAAAAGRVAVLAVTLLTSIAGAELAGAGYLPELSANPSALVLRRATMAQSAGCAGVICAGSEAAAVKGKLGHAFMVVTPGIRPAGSDSAHHDQRRIATPAAAMAAGADYLVVGRPIRDAADPVAAARRIVAEMAAA